MISQEEIDKVKEKLKGMILDSGREVQREIEEEGGWGFVVEHGHFNVSLFHPKTERRMFVLFMVQFRPETIAGIPKRFGNLNEKREFEFGLVSSISSPLTSYKMYHDPDGNLSGFEVMKVIYPFHEGFSIRDFEESIQAVTSAGVLGMNYLAKALGQGEMTQEVAEALSRPAPENLYF
jgi:hypothetical protein